MYMTWGIIIIGCITLIPNIFVISQHVGYTVTVQIPSEGREPSAMTELRATRGPCTCEDDLCSCCTGVFMQQLNQRGCVNLAYDPDDFALSVKVSMNDRTIYKNSVSGKNPQPVCAPIPRLPALKLCVKFSNVYLTGRNIHACIDMEGRFFETSMFKLAFDCVRMGANGVALLKPEDGGGVPDDYDVPDDGPDYDIEGEGSVEAEVTTNTTKKGNSTTKVTLLATSSTKPVSITPPSIKVTATTSPVTLPPKITSRFTTTVTPSTKVTAVTSRPTILSTVNKVTSAIPVVTSTTSATSPTTEMSISQVTTAVDTEQTTQYTSYDINTPNSKLGNVVPLK